MRINKWIMLPSGSVIAGRGFFPGFGFEFSLEVVHRPHAGMRIAVPHKYHPGFLNTGHGDKRTMIVSVSLIDFR
ncbi:hypothetical protein BW88_03990 [Escherichia coli O79:H7 str. 06-3501]|nr:hypothetical protein BW88_03990 [Escherichia coli O79:H7 str. 06-3501]